MSDSTPLPPQNAESSKQTNRGAGSGGSLRILSIGEILWDIFPSGEELGGAPLNFALHAAAMGARVQILSRIGSDELGSRILDNLVGRQLLLDLVQIDPAAPTGTATVALGVNGEPSFHLGEQVAWDFIEVTESALAAAREADAIYFGSLAQRSRTSREAIQHLVAQTRSRALRIFDVNLRPPHVDREVIEASLRLANVLKVNQAELLELGGMFGIRSNSTAELPGALAGAFDLEVVACTLGSEGSILYCDGETRRHPGVAAEVANSVGAGDAFTAVLAIGLLTGQPLDEINRCANEAAAFVCSKSGATPVLPPEFLHAARGVSSKAETTDFVCLS